jgi:hypothetical protein
MAIMHFKIEGKKNETKKVSIRCQNKNPSRADKENAVKVLRSRFSEFKICKQTLVGFDRYEKKGASVDFDLSDIHVHKPGCPDKKRFGAVA